MKQSFEGASAGTGAVYGWAGNADVGEGRMTIVDEELGRYFEQGLATMKSVAEAPGSTRAGLQ